MKVTWKKVRNLSPCSEALAWGQDHFADRQEINASTLLMALLKDKHFQWANWLLARLLTKAQAVQYAIFAAEQVIGIFEKKHPRDDRPRKAIEAAMAYLKNPAVKTRSTATAADAADAATAAYAAAYAAADAAADAAATAADAATAAYAAADAAAYASDAATAADAADAAYAAYAAADAADAAADAAKARKSLQTKILRYGIHLLGEDGGT